MLNSIFNPPSSENLQKMMGASEFRSSRRVSRQSSSQPLSPYDKAELSCRNSLNTNIPPIPSYKPAYLEMWHMSYELYTLLPETMQKYVTSLQQTGALALTIFERIDKLYQELGGKVSEPNSDEECTKAGDVAMSIVSAGLPMEMETEMIRHISSRLASLEIERALPDCTPSLSSLPSLPVSLTSTRSTSLSRLEPLSPSLHQPKSMIDWKTGSVGGATSPPWSPFADNETKPTLEDEQKEVQMSASALQSMPLSKNPCLSITSMSKNRTFYRPPMNPRIAMWRAEVSYLRNDAMVNLRHYLRKVEMGWRLFCTSEEKPVSSPTSPSSEMCAPTCTTPKDGFEEMSQNDVEHPITLERAKELWVPWIGNIKNLVAKLEIRSRDLSQEEVSVPGWGA